MKKLSVILILIVMSIQTAFAFPMHTQVFYGATQASATVFNHYGRPVICDLTATGITRWGQPVYAYLRGTVIYPGMTGYAYVYTNYNNPFVNANAYANCYWF